MEETVIWEQHTVTLHRVGATNPTALLASVIFSLQSADACSLNA